MASSFQNSTRLFSTPSQRKKMKNKKKAKKHRKKKKGPKTEAKTLTAEEQEAQLQAKREDLIQTGASLYTRYPEIYTELANAFRDDESVQILGAALNKAYENRDTLIFKGKIEKKKYKYCGMEKLLI
ncbi:DALR anticodon binding domain containing protein [Histomonas meleagridis]|uniref:DALR anticodon binding domain containing protein n=1 Tax=Histomonas meleagridis TaxID=135588 RepID=UPI00355A8D24|nr:DALR anticodon binding domain containing protein [Histomonas meleagridis]